MFKQNLIIKRQIKIFSLKQHLISLNYKKQQETNKLNYIKIVLIIIKNKYKQINN